jgi:hypothetical protein
MLSYRKIFKFLNPERNFMKMIIFAHLMFSMIAATAFAENSECMNSRIQLSCQDLTSALNCVKTDGCQDQLEAANALKSAVASKQVSSDLKNQMQTELDSYFSECSDLKKYDFVSKLPPMKCLIQYDFPPAASTPGFFPDLSEAEKNDMRITIEPHYCRTPEYRYAIPSCN